MKAILSAILGVALAATAICGSGTTANAHDSAGFGFGILGGLAAGAIIGFDIDHASTRMDISTLETFSLPLRHAKVA